MTGTGTQTDPYIVTTWNEMLTAIAQDGVYVQTDKAYTFNIDEIYKDSVVPKSIPIGYNTQLDCKKSTIVSEKWTTIDDFDFEGQRALIYGLKMPASKKMTAGSCCLYIADTWEQLLLYGSYDYFNNNKNDKTASFNVRIKISTNLVVDLNDEQKTKTYDIRIGILQANNLTIKNGRNQCFTFNTISGSSPYSEIWNLNIIDCISTGTLPVFQGDYIEYHECSFKVLPKGSGAGAYLTNRISSYSNSPCHFYSCNISQIGGYCISYTWDTNFYDCNIYIDGAITVLHDSITYRNCYVFGKGTLSYSKFGDTQNSIFEIETTLSKEFTAGSYAWHNVFNKDLAPNITIKSGGKLLTTEEIRNPQKLFDAGIPINPTGG